jgi:hypothetical protein
MSGRTGETFTGALVEVDKTGRRGTVMLKDPAVEARVVGTDLPLGREVRLRVASVDLEKDAVIFEVV